MPNRLAASHSLYLRKHAENPIDWWPWCEAAVVTARQEDKPVFLSIGYSSCHWCTVMEGEAFSDETIAAYMNANFLPIKVDREERPDVDSIYMQALQLLTGQGGWPLNVVLSPTNLVPFYGGTYFPVEPKYGRPGFLQVLMALRRFYDRDKDQLVAITTEIFNHIQQSARLPTTSTPNLELLRRGLTASCQILLPSDRGTSFPMMPHAEAALRGMHHSWEEVELDYWQLCLQRGQDLALGGIYDQVGGGFHRYTVDPFWTVPHFEKMLYDNGQIMTYLAQLWRLGGQDPSFSRAVAGTVAWLKREMTAPEGYFYAAQDADSFITQTDREPEEGAFYVWAYATLESLLTPTELTQLEQAFTVSPTGNFEGQNVLQRTQPGELAPAVEAILEKLFIARYGMHPEQWSQVRPARHNQEAKTTSWPGRIPPVTDTKLIVAWNSLMISGLAQAALAFGRSDYLALAIRATQFILDQQWVNGRLQRLNYDGQPQVAAQSEDYAFLIQALLDLDQADLGLAQGETSNRTTPDWLKIAIRLQEELDQQLWDLEQGGYLNTTRDSSQSLLVRERSYQDNATPSANGIALTNLVRLALLTEDLTYLDRAEQGLRAFGMVMEQIPKACPSLFGALDWWLTGTVVKTTVDRIPALIHQVGPTTVFMPTQSLPSGVVGLVCRGLSCLEPAMSEQQLQDQLQQCR